MHAAAATASAPSPSLCSARFTRHARIPPARMRRAPAPSRCRAWSLLAAASGDGHDVHRSGDDAGRHDGAAPRARTDQRSRAMRSKHRHVAWYAFHAQGRGHAESESAGIRAQSERERSLTSVAAGSARVLAALSSLLVLCVAELYLSEQSAFGGVPGGTWAPFVTGSRSVSVRFNNRSSALMVGGAPFTDRSTPPLAPTAYQLPRPFQAWVSGANFLPLATPPFLPRMQLEVAAVQLDVGVGAHLLPSPRTRVLAVGGFDFNVSSVGSEVRWNGHQSDVWGTDDMSFSSADSWTRISNGAFPARRAFGMAAWLPDASMPAAGASAALSGAQIQLLLVGGLTGGWNFSAVQVAGDAWLSVDGGASFTQLSAPPFAARYQAALAVTRSVESGTTVLALAGGALSLTDMSALSNEVWMSLDAGHSWSQAPQSAQFTPRAAARMIAFNGHFFMSGGQTRNTRSDTHGWTCDIRFDAPRRCSDVHVAFCAGVRLGVPCPCVRGAQRGSAVGEHAELHQRSSAAW